MNSNYISTQSLYDSGAHLEHRNHKYFKKEPDGHGGFRYFYENTVNNFKSTTGLGAREVWQKQQKWANRYDDPSTHTGGTYQMALKVRKLMQETEGTPRANTKDFKNQKKNNDDLIKVYEEKRARDQSVADRAKAKYDKTPLGKAESFTNKTIDTISTAAGSVYDKGISFLKSIFK